MLGLILATRIIDQRFVGEYGPVILNGVGKKEKSDPCHRVNKPNDYGDEREAQWLLNQISSHLVYFFREVEF